MDPDHPYQEIPSSPTLRKVQVQDDDDAPPTPFLERTKQTFQWIRKESPANLKSGITVCLVSLPLSISLSIASGASPMPGIVAAFWGGITRDLLGSSVFNIMGPTGGISGILSGISTSFGPKTLPLLSIFTGLIVQVIHSFKVIDYLMLMPASVISGFTLGVALIMALTQLDSALGLEVDHQSSRLLGKTLETLGAISNAHYYPLLIFVVTLIMLFYCARRFPLMPAPIVATTFGVLMGYLSTVFSNVLPGLTTLYSRYGVMTLDLFLFPKWVDIVENWYKMELWTTALSCAIILVLESLISAKVADHIAKKEHDRQQEVLGIGWANFVSGVFGGLPISAALARTSLNVKSGATSKLSSTYSCILLLIVYLIIAPIIQYLSIPSVAAIVSFVAYRMVDWAQIKHFYQLDRASLIILILTTLICVLYNTIMALLLGVVVAIFVLLKNISLGHAEIQIYHNTTLIGVVDVDILDGPRRAENRPSKKKHWRQHLSSLSGNFASGELVPTPVNIGPNQLVALSYGDTSHSPTASTKRVGLLKSQGGILCEKELPLDVIKVKREEKACKLPLIVLDNGQDDKEPSHPPTNGMWKSPSLQLLPTTPLLSTSPHLSVSPHQNPPPSFSSTHQHLPPPISTSHQNIPHSSISTTPLLNNNQKNKKLCQRISLANCLVYRVSGSLTYVHTLSHLRRLKKCIEQGGSGIRFMVLVLRTCPYIDLDGADLIQHITDMYKSHNIKLVLAGITSNSVWASLKKHDWFNVMNEEGLVFPTWSEALRSFFPEDLENPVEPTPVEPVVKRHLRTISSMTVISYDQHTHHALIQEEDY